MTNRVITCVDNACYVNELFIFQSRILQLTETHQAGWWLELLTLQATLPPSI